MYIAVRFPTPPSPVLIHKSICDALLVLDLTLYSPGDIFRALQADLVTEENLFVTEYITIPLLLKRNSATL